MCYCVQCDFVIVVSCRVFKLFSFNLQDNLRLRRHVALTLYNVSKHLSGLKRYTVYWADSLISRCA
jgi:hypothetical protein